VRMMSLAKENFAEFNNSTTLLKFMLSL